MNQSREELLTLLKAGQAYDIATSEYSIDPIESTGWNPIARAHHATLRSMVKRGEIYAEFFWRGARVGLIPEYTEDKVEVTPGTLVYRAYWTGSGVNVDTEHIYMIKAVNKTASGDRRYSTYTSLILSPMTCVPVANHREEEETVEEITDQYESVRADGLTHGDKVIYTDGSTDLVTGVQRREAPDSHIVEVSYLGKDKPEIYYDSELILIEKRQQEKKNFVVECRHTSPIVNGVFYIYEFKEGKNFSVGMQIKKARRYTEQEASRVIENIYKREYPDYAYFGARQVFSFPDGLEISQPEIDIRDLEEQGQANAVVALIPQIQILKNIAESTGLTVQALYRHLGEMIITDEEDGSIAPEPGLTWIIQRETESGVTEYYSYEGQTTGILIESASKYYLESNAIQTAKDLNELAPFGTYKGKPWRVVPTPGSAPVIADGEQYVIFSECFYVSDYKEAIVWDEDSTKALVFDTQKAANHFMEMFTGTDVTNTPRVHLAKVKDCPVQWIVKRSTTNGEIYYKEGAVAPSVSLNDASYMTYRAASSRVEELNYQPGEKGQIGTYANIWHTIPVVPHYDSRADLPEPGEREETDENWLSYTERRGY